MNERRDQHRRILETSTRTSWALGDVLPEGARLDLGRNFLPETLAGVQTLPELSPGEQRTLNQLRGATYLGMFGLVEEFILPFLLDHLRSRSDREDFETRALLQFAGEEAKHIQLFRLFSERFREDCGATYPLIGPSAELARDVLSHHPLGVALAILHIEWMTQRHYVDSVKTDDSLDPLFASLLRHHWVEESRHAKLDQLVVEDVASQLSPREVRAGIADYGRIVAMLESGLDAQVELDLAALEPAIGRALAPAVRDVIRDGQRRAYRFTFIESGATHPRFIETYRALHLL